MTDYKQLHEKLISIVEKNIDPDFRKYIDQMNKEKFSQIMPLNIINMLKMRMREVFGKRIMLIMQKHFKQKQTRKTCQYRMYIKN